MNLIRKSVRKLDAYVPGEQPSGRDVVKLNTNENPYPPSPGVKKLLEELDADGLRRYPDPACTALRSEIAKLHGCGEENVFVGRGADEALALCTDAFVEKGGCLGYFVPSYSLYPVLADIREMEKVPVPLASDFGWPEEEALTSAGRCSLFFVCRPNAPTGTLFSRAQVSEFCRAMRGVVVIDEAYVDFAEDHCVDLALERGNVIVIRSLSKGYSLAGLRVGYAVGPRELMEALFKIKDSYNLSTIAQGAAREAVADQACMRANVERIKNTRGRLTKALRELDFDVAPSHGNFVWVRRRGMSSQRIFRQLKSKDIYVRYFPGEMTGEFLRITVGTEEEIDILLRAIETLK